MKWISRGELEFAKNALFPLLSGPGITGRKTWSSGKGIKYKSVASAMQQRLAGEPVVTASQLTNVQIPA